MYKNDVGVMYSHSKKKNLQKLMNIYSPLYRHRFCTYMIYIINLNLYTRAHSLYSGNSLATGTTGPAFALARPAKP
jgi:hypothetical protein